MKAHKISHKGDRLSSPLEIQGTAQAFEALWHWAYQVNVLFSQHGPTLVSVSDARKYLYCNLRPNGPRSSPIRSTFVFVPKKVSSNSQETDERLSLTIKRFLLAVDSLRRNSGGRYRLLRYIKCARWRFGSWLYSRVQVICCHTDMFFCTFILAINGVG